MSSPGLKRPLEFEMPPHTSGSSGTSPNGPVASNGNKRRYSHYPNSQQTRPAAHSNSAFKDPSTILTSPSEEIANSIKDEVYKAPGDSNGPGGQDSATLTVRQAQIIFERLIKERESKLRDEYDKILACKLAEQYDLLSKANYLNSYVESRLPTTALTPPAGNTQSINALAAAFSAVHRSQAGPTPTGAVNSMPDLSSFAASLTANGHPSALTTTQLAYNLQQHAAAAAIQQVQQQQVQQTQQRLPTANSSLPSGPVLLASSLDEQLATPEALFTLFGVFGDVVRVKILFNKKDNALIQMADANQAQVAQGYLDKQRVFGKVIRVTRSKHQLVQMPRDGNQSDAGLTKDFTNSPLHRFKIPGSRNYLNIYPPSNTLHISNIPATIDENDIHRAFEDACGFKLCSFKFFPKDRKMALIKFNSIEHATIALIKMHNYQISDENNLRVSFSKSFMQQS